MTSVRDNGGYPDDLLTDGNGQSRRIRVDPGSTGFFAGREFRTFYEFSLGANAIAYFKVSSPIDFNVEGLGIQVDVGECSLEAFASDVVVVNPANFNVDLPILGCNRMLQRPKDSAGNYYTTGMTIKTGTATFSGGTKLDIVTVKTTGNSNQSSTQDAAVAGERGLPPGDVYLKLTNKTNALASGIMRARWEDRP